MRYFLLLLTLLSFTNESFAQDCPNSSRPGIHVVQRGETLWGISRQYQMTVDEIVSLNQIDVNSTLRRCTELRVGGASAPSDNQAAPGGAEVVEEVVLPVIPSATGLYLQRLESSGGVHRIKQGETIFSIAKYYGYTVDRLREMNGLTAENIIQPGQNLIVSTCFFQNGGRIGGN